MTFDIPEIEAIDQGIYDAIVKKVALKDIETGEYAGNTIRIWTFEVDVNGVKQEVTSSSSLNTGPRSKSFAWLSAILGRMPIPGEKGLSPVGKACRVHLIVDADSGYNKVATVLPASNTVQQAATPVTAAPTATDDDLPPMEYPLDEPPQYAKEDMP